MNKINLFFFTLAITSTACVQTVIEPVSAPSAAGTPPLTERSPVGSQEPDSGAVFSQDPGDHGTWDPGEPAAFRTPETICASVTANKALHMRAEPSEKSRVIDWLYAGQVVKVIHQEADWWMIQIAGKTGYAKADYLTESECP